MKINTHKPTVIWILIIIGIAALLYRTIGWLFNLELPYSETAKQITRTAGFLYIFYMIVTEFKNKKAAK
ncbi:hypothetical protein [Pseudofulvibacter geojedonensis]|uniref:Uncharacterized protein n=1 Tax=Pseudofulvibacter geojedonensis TaxID=1123758 RepID=A0ABW3I5F6_9FLAO